MTRKMKLAPKLTEHEEFVLDVMAYMKAASIVVFNARVAVIRDPEEKMTAGGLYIPDEAQRKESRGTVVGVGLGVDLTTGGTDQQGNPVSGFKLGDKVMFTKYNPTLFTIRLPDGREANLELMHVSDLYLGWRL